VSVINSSNWLIVLGFSLLCWAAMVTFLLLAMRHLTKSREKQDSQAQALLTRTLDSLDRATALAASGDALTYQAIRLPEAVDTYPGGQYDPSDAGEIERINARYRGLTGEMPNDQDEEPLDGATEQALDELFRD
jgi:hypothetical protein